MDILLNENFDLDFDDRNDLPLATGRVLFEQRLRVAVTSFFQDVIGDTDKETALKLLKSYAEEIAGNFDEIESVAGFTAEYDTEEPNTINLTLIYDTGDALTFPLSE